MRMPAEAGMPRKPAIGHITAAQRQQKERDSTVASIKPAPRIDAKAYSKGRERATANRTASTDGQATYDDVVRTIRHDKTPDPSFVDRIIKCSRIIVATRIDELKQPKLSETVECCGEVIHATDVLLSLLGIDGEVDTSYSKFPHFIHIYRNDLDYPSQWEFIEYLRDLRHRAAEVKERFSAKTGRTRAWSRTDAPKAQELTALTIIEAWSVHHGQRPSASNVEAWEAADQLWHASGGPEYSDASYERWRRSFATARNAEWPEVNSIRKILKAD
jgi:hypothetical protein